MNIAVRYYTKTGNTKKLADAIGAALGVQAADVSVPLPDHTDLLFLGSSVYAAGVDKEIKQFIWSLSPGHVGKVVNFSTAALLPSTFKQVKRLVEDQNLIMADDEFHCRGSFKMMHRGKPDVADLKAAAEFATEIVEREGK